MILQTGFHASLSSQASDSWFYRAICFCHIGHKYQYGSLKNSGWIDSWWFICMDLAKGMLLTFDSKNGTYVFFFHFSKKHRYVQYTWTIQYNTQTFVLTFIDFMHTQWSCRRMCKNVVLKIQSPFESFISVQTVAGVFLCGSCILGNVKFSLVQLGLSISSRHLVPSWKTVCLAQRFLTGGTRTPWGYQTPQQGVRSTNIFRHTRPENFKDVLSIVVSAVNFVRSQTLNHGLFRVFSNEV